MAPEPALLCFDYLDPLSYLVEREVQALSGEDLPPLRRLPLELRPPPEDLLDPDLPEWKDRWTLATAEARRMGVTLTSPALIPWTRKAHELVLHARAKGKGHEAHAALFDAVFQRGGDVGRVDVLVELARGLGLDPTETKAVLDVDRYAPDVAALREEALAAGAVSAPTLIRGARTLQGFHNRDALRTFLLR